METLWTLAKLSNSNFFIFNSKFSNFYVYYSNILLNYVNDRVLNSDPFHTIANDRKLKEEI